MGGEEEIGYRYAYRLRQGPRTIVRATFNDLPFYREPSHSFADTAARCDHLLQPGKNTMSVEVWEGPESPDSPELLGPVRLSLHELVMPIDEEQYIARILWPEDAAARKDDKKPEELPWGLTVQFEMPEDHPRPYYMDLRPEEIPEQGTPDLREAVRRIHDALMQQQPRLFVDEMRLDFEEQRRYYPTDARLSIGSVLPDVEAQFKKRMQVEPLPPEQLRFESRAGGRVALAMRRDGLPVLWAQGIDEQGHMNIDPMFVRKDGMWTLYR